MTNIQYYDCGWPSEIKISEKGRIDSNAKTAFTNGQCHSLAYAIHKLTGWPMVGLRGYEYDEDGGDDWGRDYFDPGSHVVVESPKGLLDIDGLGARERWQSKFGEMYEIPIDPETIHDGFEGYLRVDESPLVNLYAYKLVRKYFRSIMLVAPTV